MKARKVRGLEPEGTLADNAERIVRVRLDELQSFIPRALDPTEVVALHDMRIAAKRLRYVLEVTAETCFGPYAETALKRTKDLQDLLGEIHDCDVQLPRVLERLEELRAAGRCAPRRTPTISTRGSRRGPRTRAPGAASRRSPSISRRGASCSTSASWRCGRASNATGSAPACSTRRASGWAGSIR